MAEFVLHQKKDGSYYGAIYRDGDKEFHAFGAYADVFYDADGDLNELGKRLATTNVPLMGYVRAGMYSEPQVSWEKDATEADIGWLSGLDYEA